MDFSIEKELSFLEKLFLKKKALNRSEKEAGLDRIRGIRLVASILEREYESLELMRTILLEKPDLPDLWAHRPSYARATSPFPAPAPANIRVRKGSKVKKAKRKK